MRLDRFTFDGTGTDKWVLTGGNFFMLVSTTAVVTVKYLKHGQVLTDETATNVDEGYYTQPERQGNEDAFDTVEVTSASAQTVKAFVSRGNGGVNKTFGAVNATPVASDNWTPSADVTLNAAGATQVLAARAGRISAVVRSDPANPDTVRVGDSNVSATGTKKGDFIMPGEARTVEFTGAVYIDTGTANANTFTLSELY